MAPGDGEDTLEFLSLVLRYHMLCSTHHRYPPKAYQAFWTVKIDTFRAACEAERKIQESKNAQTDVTKLSERKKAKDPYKGVGNSTVKTTLSPPNNTKDDSKRAARYWSDKGYDTSSFIILGKNDIEEDNVAPHDKISTVAQELLSSAKKIADNEVSPGLVYVFAVPGNKGFVKVGFTTKEVKVRHEKWRKDCNRDSLLLYPLEEVPPKVKHAHRVERLVHAELMEHNVRIYCERCGMQHIEWFEAEADVAIASVQKWSLWMESKPYEERVTREGSKWHLKKTERERLHDIGTFLKDLQEGIQKFEAAK
ncbi:DNA-binding protein [Akanthomyces lecanii RCEF 1005]|uniref:DNA-binding protein n=1 Tax=Akanthomyces lecanii RCEF 1005 TaxID=1081108 RepID=A0A168G753_CORDF|nr:DNA-binding protein [Akanthomyces lecanii RCEF 1005]